MSLLRSALSVVKNKMCDDLDLLEEFLEATIDDEPLGFGKYKGRTPKEVLYINPGYIVWAKENVSLFECSDEVYEQAKEDYEMQTREDEPYDPWDSDP